MKLKRTGFILVLIVSAALTLQACGPGESPTGEDAANAIETSVAATIEAGQVQDTAIPQPTPIWTIQPTVTASPPETNFDYAGLRFYFNDLLADNITAGVNPGLYDENTPYWSTPEYREYIFNNWVLSDAFHTPAIRIYPVAEFIAMNANVGGALAALDAAVQAEPLNIGGLSVPDLFNAGQLYISNPRAMRFQNGYGARWLSQYGQAYSLVGWPHLFYTFQGFTDDGLYYVSVILPVNHPSLPGIDSVPIDDAFYENFEAYAAGIRAQLEAEADNSFFPSLVLLDQLVASLLVGSP
jgi:hypothetical protein